MPGVVTLGPDDEGWTYTINGRTGLLVGNPSLHIAHSYTRRDKNSYFVPCRPDKGEEQEATALHAHAHAVKPYVRVLISRTRCERQNYGSSTKEFYTKFKLFLFKNDTDGCFIKKFRVNA